MTPETLISQARCVNPRRRSIAISTGRLGEDLVAERLALQGFTDIENLNLRRHNYPFGDLLATMNHPQSDVVFDGRAKPFWYDDLAQIYGTQTSVHAPYRAIAHIKPGNSGGRGR